MQRKLPRNRNRSRTSRAPLHAPCPAQVVVRSSAALSRSCLHTYTPACAPQPAFACPALPPQVVVCSNARRTRQTLDVMAAAWPALAEADSHFLGSLYTTAALDGQTRGHLSDIVAAEAAAEHSCCLCLGHNKVRHWSVVWWVWAERRRVRVPRRRARVPGGAQAAGLSCWVWLSSDVPGLRQGG